MSLSIMLIALVIMILIGVPVCYALGLSSVFYLFSNPNFLTMIPQRIWSGADSPLMIALPLFIIAGELMNSGGLTKRLIDFSMYLVKPIKGDLGEVNVVASMIFGGISGSSVADTSALGSILIPQMTKKGFTPEFSTGITVASSTMGMVIPPSIPMLLYSMISGESVGALFLAGLIPGILVGVTQLLLANIITRYKRFSLEEVKLNWKNFFYTAKDGIFAIIMPLMIVLSIAFGIVTATESAGIAVLYALIIGFVVYRELKLKVMISVLKKALLNSSSVMIIIAFSIIFTWILAFEHIPDKIGIFMTGLNINRIWILIFLDIFILFVGMFIDVSPALLLLSPILIPVMLNFGIGPLQLGAILIVGLAIGLATPPIGMCLYVASKISGLPISKIFKGAFPFLICNVIILFLVTFIPEISTWIPGLFFK